MLGGLFEIRVQLLEAIAFLIFFPASAQDPGKKIFEENCMVCHTIGGGPLVGPDLKGVNSKYDKEWLVKFIQSSQSLVNSGDENAVKIFYEFNMMPMPDQPFDKGEILSILAYVNSESEKDTDVATGYVETEFISLNNESNKVTIMDTKPAYIALLSPFLIVIVVIELITVGVLVMIVIFFLRVLKIYYNRRGKKST